MLSITHKSLVVGHTQNEDDVSHSFIGKKKHKKALKFEPNLRTILVRDFSRGCKIYGEAFKVHKLDYDFFLEFKNLVDVTRTNFNMNSESVKFNFNNI